MVKITRSIMLSKIDYGLPIYGWCASSNIKLIKAPYHAAVRRSIGAFPTSPTKNTLAEAGMPSIEERTLFLTYKLAPKLFICRNKTLYKEINRSISYKRKFKRESTILKCIGLLRHLNVNIKPRFLKNPSEPPWHFESSSVILSLTNLSKISTDPIIYQQTYYNTIIDFTAKNWKLLFTDGSKTNFSTTFATVEHKGNIINCGQVDNYCSNFTAEALAVYMAVEFASKSELKYIICTDSLSTINGLQNPNNDSPLINDIRNICIKHSDKIKIMWVPSHVGIPGNELADLAASEAKHRPLLVFPTYEARDIINAALDHLKTSKASQWSTYNHNYKNINPSGTKSIFPVNCSKKITSTIVRLRIGHCKFSHRHLLEKNPAPLCPNCNTQLTAAHILNDCPTYSSCRENIFKSQTPTDLLKNLCESNIKLVFKFIVETSLIDSI
ncbi:hypothetical protein EVAR_71375_1 [Eumeta japonica]|uniref:RNase H type-1 domain-containing protein n=1 Tax=Eumeta variegata TaxID=151549 RepID=A0A4C1SWN1_EUMVA|nr:hypothetical protein EVAR_71375_1 [Eumeta japonica]